MATPDPAETARATGDALQSSLDAASEVSRRVFSAWADGAEATLKAMFDAQNTALQANMSVLQSATVANQAAVRRWTEMARQAQRAALEAFRANLEMGAKGAQGTQSGEGKK